MIRARFLAFLTFPTLGFPIARLKCVLRDRRAVSAVEFAILAPALIALPVPIVDLGMGLYAQMELQNAAQAGAQYALLHTSSGQFASAPVQSAAAAATPLAITTNVSQSCGCPNGNLIIPGPCNNTCPDGEAIKTYVTITAHATYSPLVSYPVLGNSVALSAQSLVRIH